MTKSQKVWVKPELIILVRSKPEEAVLGGCKQLIASSGSGNAATACYLSGCLGVCDSTAGS